MRRLKLTNIIFIIAALILFYRCSDGDLDLGKKFVKTNTYTQKIDTVTIQLSTIISDSVTTSGASNNLVGFFSHDLIGEQQATSYTGINAPSTFTWDTDLEDPEIYDSCVFYFTLDGYTIGDTTQLFTLNISELTEDIEAADDGYFYSHFTVDYNTEPIASLSFYPRPVHEPDHSVKVDDDFAERIITFMRKYKNHEDKTTLYYEQFPGISLWSNEAECALGMYTADTSSYFTIYSHKQDAETEDIERTISFRTSYSFHHLETTENGIFDLDSREDRLSSEETENVSILQGSSGYKIRVDMPYLENLKNILDGGYLVKALLQVETNLDYQDIDELPTSLYIGELDKWNRITTYLYDSSGDLNTGSLQTDYIYNEDNYYIFDVTTWVRAQLAKDITTSDYGFVLDFDSDLNSETLTYFFANAQNTGTKKTKLITYIYKYDE